MKLYHGSTVAVRKPSVKRGRPTVDFGQGFYTTTSYEQAKKWAELKRKRTSAPHAVVTEYEVADDILQGRYTTLFFSGPTQEWLDFVAENRSGNYNGKSYDIVYGPVANDDVYTTFTLYQAGALTKEQTLETLKIKKLYDQMVFTTEKALSFLKFAGIIAEEEM